MSNAIVHSHPRVGELRRRSLVVLAILLVVAASLTVYLVSSGSDTSPTPTVHSALSSGPNESIRGQSAASATGVRPVPLPVTSGPNEDARGNAAHDATQGK